MPFDLRIGRQVLSLGESTFIPNGINVVNSADLSKLRVPGSELKEALLGRIVVAYTLLPRYMDGELVTAYALLERRFGTATRRFASITFMFTRAFGDSVRVFATGNVKAPLAEIVPFPGFNGGQVETGLTGSVSKIETQTNPVGEMIVQRGLNHLNHAI